MILVAGGGPAGATVAALLAGAGRDVRVIERTTGPTHKICGEFLSHEALAILSRLGLDVADLGGHRIGGVRLVRGARLAEAALPFTALGLSRHVLDEALLAHAQSRGAVLMRGETITQADDTTLTLTGGRPLIAETLFLATGKHDLRGARRSARAEDLVGFKMHFSLGPNALAALRGHVEIMLFRDAYVGLQLIATDRANLCLLVRQRFLEQSGGTFETLLEALQRRSAHLRSRLNSASPLLDKPPSIFRVPYGYVHAAAAHASRAVFRLGDQAAVIPSFTGDGMSMALHSAALAANMFLKGNDAYAYHQQLHHDLAGQVRRAWWMYRLGAWPPGQAALMAVARTWAPSLRAAAAFTRVPSAAIAQALR